MSDAKPVITTKEGYQCPGCGYFLFTWDVKKGSCPVCHISIKEDTF